MTTYVPEAQNGQAIALFWVVFKLGGSVGSFVSFGLNYHSAQGAVTNSTYIAFIVIMALDGFSEFSSAHLQRSGWSS